MKQIIAAAAAEAPPTPEELLANLAILCVLVAAAWVMWRVDLADQRRETNRLR